MESANIKHIDQTNSTSQLFMDIIPEKVFDEFPNYKEDTAFGGTKFLVKIKFTKNVPQQNFKILYITPEKCLDSMKVNHNRYFTDNTRKFLLNIVANKIIENDKIYDLNSGADIRLLDRHKLKWNNCIIDDDEFKDRAIIVSDKYDTVRKHFLSDTILNKKYYVDTVSSDKDRVCIYLEKSTVNGGHRTFAIIDNKRPKQSPKIDKEYWNKYFPYCCDINDVTGEIYNINRGYEYIGCNTKSLSDIRDDSENFTREYTTPKGQLYNPCDFYILSVQNFINISNGKTTCNPNEKTTNLLNIMLPHINV